jgi:hypothetical protein
MTALFSKPDRQATISSLSIKQYRELKEFIYKMAEKQKEDELKQKK